MKQFKIKYQKGSNIYVQYVSAQDKKEAMYLFYMENKDADIIEIKVNEES